MNSCNLDRNESGTVTQSITLNVGGRQVSFYIDTGYNGAIGLDHDTFLYFQDWGITEARKSGGLEYGLTGQVAANSDRFKTGNLLGTVLKNISVDDNVTVSVIGLGILVNYNFILDFQEGKFYYQQRHCPPPINPMGALGAIMLFPHGKPTIAQLAPGGGPAETAGMKTGDEVVRLDGKTGAEINAYNLYELCLEKGGKSIEAEIVHQGESKSQLVHITLAPNQWIFPPENIGWQPGKGAEEQRKNGLP